MCFLQNFLHEWRLHLSLNYVNRWPFIFLVDVARVMISLSIHRYLKNSRIFMQVTRSLICKSLSSPKEENVKGTLLGYLSCLWTLQIKNLEQKAKVSRILSHTIGIGLENSGNYFYLKHTHTNNRTLCYNIRTDWESLVLFHSFWIWQTFPNRGCCEPKRGRLTSRVQKNCGLLEVKSSMVDWKNSFCPAQKSLWISL